MYYITSEKVSYLWNLYFRRTVAAQIKLSKISCLKQIKSKPSIKNDRT